MSRRISWILGVTIALAVTACGGGGAATEAPAGSEPPAASGDAGAGAVCAPSTGTAAVEVGIDGRAFSPGRVTAAVGDVIVFTNGDPVPHTATLDDGSCTTESLGDGESGGLVFNVAGEYPFHCRIHPDMTGTFEITG